MKAVVVADVPWADPSSIDALGSHCVATMHEAMRRTGLVGASLRPIQEGIRIAGSAVTVLCWPGDNLTIHVAVEQCREGDVLVVTTGGVRDFADLRATGFPVWAAAVHAQETVKATAGSVNVPITVGGAAVCAGDVIVADDERGGVRGRTMAAVEGIPCLYLRGGTSKGAFFLRPTCPKTAASATTSCWIMGTLTPGRSTALAPRTPLTSKVALISPSADDGTDVHYLFLQFGVDEAFVTDRQNCGNYLAGVGPSTVERGLVPAGYGDTEVRIRCSTRSAWPPLGSPPPGGVVDYDGDWAVDGVPGTAGAIKLDFEGTAGSSTEALFPTGNVVDHVAGVDVTCVDNGMPSVLLRARVALPSRAPDRPLRRRCEDRIDPGRVQRQYLGCPPHGEQDLRRTVFPRPDL